MDDETRIDIKPVVDHSPSSNSERRAPVRPTGFVAITPVSGHRTKFWVRMRAMWDWFWLSVTFLGYIFVILAGGLLASKILILLWKVWLSGYFS